MAVSARLKPPYIFKENAMNQVEQLFFNDLEKKLWTSANKLLPALDAAVYIWRKDGAADGAA